LETKTGGCLDARRASDGDAAISGGCEGIAIAPEKNAVIKAAAATAAASAIKDDATPSGLDRGGGVGNPDADATGRLALVE